MKLYAIVLSSILNSPVKPGCAENAIVDGSLDLMPPIIC
jgi:hypothetical protein